MYNWIFVALFSQVGCQTGGCQTVYQSGCATGSCVGTNHSYISSGCNISSSGLPVVYDPVPLHMDLRNIVGGSERSRFYVKAQFQQKVYTIPVINGYLPSLSSNNPNSLVLDYGAKIAYTQNLSKQKVIVYGSPVATQEATNTPEVKAPSPAINEAPSQELKAPGLSLPPGPEPFNINPAPVPLKFPASGEKEDFNPQTETLIPRALQRPSEMLPPKEEILPTYK